MHRPLHTLEAYTPPDWASRVPNAPTHKFNLGLFPTPVHPWRAPGFPEGFNLHVKRDDLSGLQLSGNKVRKLEFLIADLLAQQSDVAVTIGGIQSNHARATAVAARYAGVDTHLILRTAARAVDEDPGLVGNLLVERLVGAQISLVTKEEYGRVGSVALGRQKEAELRAAGRRPYVIPVGGSNAIGTWGYVQAWAEILAQGQALGQPFTDVAMRVVTPAGMQACGSGGTTAGLALANHLSGRTAQIWAFCVCDDEAYFYSFIEGILRDMGALPLLEGAPVSSLVQVVQAKGAGYAISRREELECVQDVAGATGVVLDPVYSGKALLGLRRLVAAAPGEWGPERRVLFLHTGGLLGLYDKAAELQPLVQQTAPATRFPLPA